MISSLFVPQRITINSLIFKAYSSTFAVAKKNVPADSKTECPKDKNYSLLMKNDSSTILSRPFNS